MSFTVVPKLTEDATLKRARTDLTPNTSALTITGFSSPDLTPITDATGTPTDPAWTSGDGTVVGLLKGIYTKLTPPKVKITKIVCQANQEELVEQTVPSTALTLQVGHVYVFFVEQPTFYDFYVIGGDGIDYGTHFYDNGFRMFVNPTSTGSFIKGVMLYNENNELVMDAFDTDNNKWGSNSFLFKNTFELSL